MPETNRPPAPASAPLRVQGVPHPRRLMSQFNVAVSLMSVIPLLICCYLFAAKFFTIAIFQGLNGVYFLLAVIIALLGLLTGRTLIEEIIRRLVEINAKLDRLNQMQAHFVNNVAHEFRTPLTVVKGTLDNLNDGVLGQLSDDQAESVGMCRREVNRLKRLVGDLLDVARIEAGKVHLVQEEVNLQELLRAVERLLSGPVKKRGLTLTLELPDAPATLTGDRDRLQQVFINLLTNAVKFTDAGSIRIRLRREGGNVRVDIEDTGRGIATEDLDKIFDKFERVGTQEEEGSGLGLPIARDLVELHHGRLWAESELGKGSRFIVQLPLRPQAS